MVAASSSGDTGCFAEMQLANRFRATFLNRVAHDLRTPLTTVSLMADLIRSSASAAEVEEFWSLLKGQLAREQELIEQLVAATRVESRLQALALELSAQPVEPLVGAAVAEIRKLAEASSVRLESAVDGAVAAATANRDGVIRALSCALDNAVKFSPPGGAVTVTVRGRGEQVAVEVADRGDGIHPDDLPLVLVPYFRGRNATASRRPGAGLGLTEASCLLRAMHGELMVAARDGGGTVVTLLLAGA